MLRPIAETRQREARKSIQNASYRALERAVETVERARSLKDETTRRRRVSNPLYRKRGSVPTQSLFWHCRKKLAFTNYGRYGKKGAWEVDHSNPISKGGTDYFRNLVPACVECNRSKGDSRRFS